MIQQSNAIWDIAVFLEATDYSSLKGEKSTQSGMLLTRYDNPQLVKWVRSSTGSSNLIYLQPDYGYVRSNNTPIFVLSKGGHVSLWMKGVPTESWHKKRAFHCFLDRPSLLQDICFTTWWKHGYSRKKKCFPKDRTGGHHAETYQHYRYVWSLLHTLHLSQYYQVLQFNVWPSAFLLEGCEGGSF